MAAASSYEQQLFPFFFCRKKTFASCHLVIAPDISSKIAPHFSVASLNIIFKFYHAVIENFDGCLAQTGKCLPAMWETRVRSLSWEDPLEKEMATIPVFLPGKFHGWSSLVGYSPWGHKESDMTEPLHLDPCGDKVVLRVTVHSLSCNQGQNLQWSKRQIIDLIFPIMVSDFFCQENSFPAVQN